MIVRPLEEKDLPSCMYIECSSFLSPWNEAQLLYELKENPYAYLFVAEEGKHIIGMIDFWITFDQGCINQIAVLPLLRNKGVGSALLEDACHRMKRNGVKNVTLEVRTTNETAIQFYRKHGFITVLTKEKYYDNGDDAYYMERRLCHEQNNFSD